MEESYNSNTWVNEVTGSQVSSNNKCASGTHDNTSTLSTGNTVTAQVEGVFAVRQVDGKSYLYYGVSHLQKYTLFDHSNAIFLL